MQQAPTEFNGALSELFERHIRASLPARDSVLRFHGWMCRYADGPPGPGDTRVFPVRAVRGADRRQILETADGTSIAPCDNSPAWVVHALLKGADGEHPLSLRSQADFDRLMTRDIATHLFDVGRCVKWSANSRGWYVAHVLRAKDGDTAWRDWNRAEVVRRFFRTLHPCNLFFVPGVQQRELGENSDVIAYMAARLAEYYGQDLWGDFVQRAVGPVTLRGSGAVAQKATAQAPVAVMKRAAPADSGGGPVVARYRAKRLTFRRDVIESLPDGAAFEVETPFGVFRFTRQQFYSDFPNIPLTASYRENGMYHGANLHMQAMHRKVRK